MIFISAIVLYIIINKKNPFNTGYLWLYETVAPKLGKWATSLLGCSFCLLGWSAFVVGIIEGHTVFQIVRNWALSVIIYNLL